MTSRVRILGKKVIPIWLLVLALVTTGAGAAAGTILAGKVTGEIPVAVSQALLVGNPIAACDLYPFETSDTGSAGWSTAEAHTGDTSVELETGASTGGAGQVVIPIGNKTLSQITSLSYWTKVTAGPDNYRPYLKIFLDEDGDTTTDEYWIEAEPMLTFGWGVLPVIPTGWEMFDAYDLVNPLKWMGSESCDDPWGVSDPVPTLSQYIDGTATTLGFPVWDPVPFASREYGTLTVTRIVLKVGPGGPWPDFTGYVDDLMINGLEYLNVNDLGGNDSVPQGTQRLFHSPNRYVGVHADDQTGFQFASEVAVGDMYLIAVPLKNASNNNLVAQLTLSVPECIEVEVMSADQVHGNGNIINAIRTGLNTWKFEVTADAHKWGVADNLYIAVSADDYCLPGFYTINGTIEQISY